MTYLVRRINLIQRTLIQGMSDFGIATQSCAYTEAIKTYYRSGVCGIEDI